MANDERNMLIVYKSCRVSAIVMLLTAWAGLCIFAIYENKPAAWALGAQALVGIAALFIARAVYQAKI